MKKLLFDKVECTFETLEELLFKWNAYDMHCLRITVINRHKERTLVKKKM
jgi:hypothetical protein